MNAPQFVATRAKRSRVPLLVGIAGPSASGKTYSALRIAAGIQRACPGKLLVVDTEAHRAEHYADQFTFEHVPFEPPFSPTRYLQAIRYCIAQSASVIVIDSASHMHEGEGGLLDQHEQEMDRLAGPNADYKRREQMKWAAWIKPKQEQKRFIQCLLQLQINIVFCFRARDRVKPGPDGKGIELGFSAIASDDLIYEMTAQALLMPGARGVPTWNPTGGKLEQLQTKLPQQFVELLKKSGPLSEDTGEMMGRWAAGVSLGAAPNPPAERRGPASQARLGTTSGQETADSLAALVSEIAQANTNEALQVIIQANHERGWTEEQRNTVRVAARKRKQEISG